MEKQQVSKDARILITGSKGFLGKHLVQKLKDRGYTNLLTPSRREMNLLNEHAIAAYFRRHKPQYVIHLAAVVGGIGANRKNPGRFFRENLLMGVNLIDTSVLVKKFVYISTLCEYPKFTPVPFLETNIWNGYPEETNAPYAIAKKALRVMLDAYRDQYGFQSVSVIPANLAGEYDHFDLENSHVIPALIRKVQTAIDEKKPSIEVWGDGSPSREFLYAGDCAEGIIAALESDYDGKDGPVNLGTGREIKIKDLIALICSQMGYTGEVKYLTDMPNGQPRRAVSAEKAKKLFNWEAKTPLEETINRTVAYWNTIKDA